MPQRGLRGPPFFFLAAKRLCVFRLYSVPTTLELFVNLPSITTRKLTMPRHNKATSSPEFVKASDIAPRLGLVPNTIHKWHKAGLLPNVRVLRIGKRVLFNASDIEALVAGNV